MSASLPSPGPDLLSPRKVSLGRVRPPPSPLAPETPAFNRSISSFYNSPGGSFRGEDENNIVIDLGARFLRVGVAGEAIPRCVLDFNPDEYRRVGDYRHYMPADGNSRKRKRGHDRGQDWQLYSNDVRGLDLGLIGDKLERACRKADGEMLMLDERKKRLTVAVSSLLPRPVLGVVLETLFNVFQAPSVTLLPTSVSALVGSGLRTGIVLDIGWSETVATAIFEYREVHQLRTPRAGRRLAEATSALLDRLAAAKATASGRVTFEDAHEVLTRLVWCDTSNGEHGARKASPVADIEAVLPSSPAAPVIIPFSELAQPAEALFSPDAQEHEDCSLPQLLFDTLLALPTDVRKICMSRIIITGGSSRIPGLKKRLHNELKALIVQRGWDPVKNYGNVQPRTRPHSVQPHRVRGGQDKAVGSTTGSATPDSRASTPTPDTRPPQFVDAASRPQSPDHPATASHGAEPTPPAPVPAHRRRQEPDPILDKINAQQSKYAPSVSQLEGEIRLVETLGAWAGASLTAAQRVKGVVEIEREAFAKDGLWGAQGALTKESGDERERKREARKSLGGAKAIAERGFSLGIWA